MTDVIERGISAIPGVMDVCEGMMTGKPNRAEMQKKIFAEVGAAKD